MKKHPPKPTRNEPPGHDTTQPEASLKENPIGAVPEEAREASGSVGQGASPPPSESAVLATGSEPAEQVEKLRQELAAAQEAQARAEAEMAAAQESKLRALAELENVRRRVARQLEEERRYALFPLIRDLLPVLDNLRRAVDSAEKTTDASSLRTGVQLVVKQLQEVLQRHHCMEIEALGAPFDPNLHQAVGQLPTEEHPAGTVVQVAQPGFRLHDRVVRPSLVVVATAPPSSQSPEPAPPDSSQTTPPEQTEPTPSENHSPPSQNP